MAIMKKAGAAGALNFGSVLKGIKGNKFALAKKKKAEMGDGQFAQLPSGSYVMKILSVKPTTSSNGNPMIDWTLKILQGEYVGEKAHKYSMLQTEDNLAFLLQDVARLGYDIDELENPDELQEIFKELNTEKPVLRVALKDNPNGPPRVYFNQVLDPDSVEDESNDADSVDDDDAKPTKKPGKRKPKADSDDNDDSSDDDDDSDDTDEDTGDEDDKGAKLAKKPSKKSPAAEDSDDNDDSSDDNNADAGADDEAEAAVGDKVEFTKGKKTLTGKIVKMDDSAIVVKTADNKRYTLDTDDESIVLI